MTHLTPERLQALLASSEADAALLAHLEAGCDTCEAVLAESRLLDGEVDAALLGLVPRPSVSDAAPWRGAGAPGRAAKRRLPLAAAALAVAVLLAVVVGPRLFSAGTAGLEPGVKGVEAPVALALQVAVQRGDAGFEALAEGATVRAGEVLILRTDASRAARGWVLLQRGDGPAEALEEVALPAGAHVLERDLGLLGVSLDGESGPISVWVVVGAAPLSREAAVIGVESPPTTSLSRAGLRLHVLP